MAHSTFAGPFALHDLPCDGVAATMPLPLLLALFIAFLIWMYVEHLEEEAKRNALKKRRAAPQARMPLVPALPNPLEQRPHGDRPLKMHPKFIDNQDKIPAHEPARRDPLPQRPQTDSPEKLHSKNKENQDKIPAYEPALRDPLSPRPQKVNPEKLHAKINENQDKIPAYEPALRDPLSQRPQKGGPEKLHPKISEDQDKVHVYEITPERSESSSIMLTESSSASLSHQPPTPKIPPITRSLLGSSTTNPQEQEYRRRRSEMYSKPSDTPLAIPTADPTSMPTKEFQKMYKIGFKQDVEETEPPRKLQRHATGFVFNPPRPSDDDDVKQENDDVFSRPSMSQTDATVSNPPESIQKLDTARKKKSSRDKSITKHNR